MIRTFSQFFEVSPDGSHVLQTSFTLRKFSSCSFFWVLLPGREKQKVHHTRHRARRLINTRPPFAHFSHLKCDLIQWSSAELMFSTSEDLIGSKNFRLKFVEPRNIHAEGPETAEGSESTHWIFVAADLITYLVTIQRNDGSLSMDSLFDTLLLSDHMHLSPATSPLPCPVRLWRLFGGCGQQQLYRSPCTSRSRAQRHRLSNAWSHRPLLQWENSGGCFKWVFQSRSQFCYQLALLLLMWWSDGFFASVSALLFCRI